jgi:hypothetical protein
VALAALAALVLAAGCASVAPPGETIAAADLALRKADQADAQLHARLETHLAREELEKARLALQAGEHEQSRRAAEKALVHAQLAEARAEAARARRNEAEIREHIEALRAEIERAEAAGSANQPALED